jgi:hypothetical protein
MMPCSCAGPHLLHSGERKTPPIPKNYTAGGTIPADGIKPHATIKTHPSNKTAAMLQLRPTSGGLAERRRTKRAKAASRLCLPAPPDTMSWHSVRQWASEAHTKNTQNSQCAVSPAVADCISPQREPVAAQHLPVPRHATHIHHITHPAQQQAGWRSSSSSSRTQAGAGCSRTAAPAQPQHTDQLCLSDT